MKTNKISKFSRNGMKIVMAAAVVGTLAIGGFYYSNMRTQGKLSKMNGGLATCFSRTTQSFTAHMIGDVASIYLASQFLKATSNCFGEVLGLVNKNFKAELIGVSRSLNELSNDIHWFNGRLADANSDGAQSSLESRFTRLEQAKDSIDSRMEAYSEKLGKRSNYAAIAWMLSGSLLLLSMGFAAFNRRSVASIIAQAERCAARELDSVLDNSDVLMSAKVEDLLLRSMKSAGLTKSAELFSNYHAEMLEGKISIFMGKENVSNRYVSCEDIVEDPLAGLNSVNLGSIFGHVFEMLSGKIFAQGILIENSIEDDVFVYADEEALKQILHDLLANAVDSCLSSEGERRIGVRTKILGGVVLFKVTDSGEPLNGLAVRRINGEDNNADIGVRLAVAKEFMSDFNGQINCKYQRNDRGTIEGNIVELIFNRGEVVPTASIESQEILQDNLTKAGLVSLVRGTKREVLTRLNETEF